jgi:hypothetical protein
MVRRFIWPLALAALAATTCRAAEPPTAPTDAPSAPATPDPLVYRGQLVDVLPRDGIPSIDEPRFVAPGAADWLSDREPVMALELGGIARAYPLQILTRHEIVNDVLAGRPVAVTYCPLCNSGLVFDRHVRGRTLEFGVSGKLYRSALVMYDRQTDSLWTHFDGLAVQGPLTGSRLEALPSQILSFGEWREANPGGEVLSRRTGHPVTYGSNPYESYDSQDGPYAQFFPQAVNYRLPAMARVVGISGRGSPVAYPYRALARGRAGVLHHRGLVVFWRAGTASALDTETIARGRDVGATGVFEARGRRFVARDGLLLDRNTGSRWSLTGRAVSGPLAGVRLRPVPHLDAFWFAWQGYYPETLVYGVDT